MIKRPMLWLFGAYSIGIFLGEGILTASGLILAGLILGVMLSVIILPAKEWHLCCLMALFLVFGYGRMVRQPRETIEPSIFQQEKISLRGIAGSVTEKENSYQVILKDCCVINFSSEKIYKVIAYLPKDREIKVGMELQAAGQIKALEEPTNFGQFNEKSYYKSQNISFKFYGESFQILGDTNSYIQTLLMSLRSHFIQVYHRNMNKRNQGILCAMITGDKSFLEKETKELYQINGMAHILVISGLHISILAMGVYHFLLKLRIHNTISSVLTMGIIYGYGVMTGFGLSTNRAVVMLILMLLARIIGRTYDTKSAASFSGLILLIQSPTLLFQAGFLLSFSAVFGIVYVYKALEKGLGLSREEDKEEKGRSFSKKKYWIKPVKSFLMSFSITITTLPVLLWFYYEFSLYSIVLNLIMLPFLSILVALALIGGMAGCFFAPAGTFFLGGVHYILEFFQWTLVLFSKLPASIQITGRPDSLKIILYVSVLIGFLFLSSRFKKSPFLLFGLILIFVPKPSSGLCITCLDVGQGDGIVIQAQRETMLIDGGSSSVKKIGEYRLIPFLKAKGIRRIQYAVMTHGDEDHVSGLKELMEEGQKEIIIENLIVPITNEVEESYLHILDLAEKKKIPIWRIKQGDEFMIGKKGMITCLHPDKEKKAESRNETSVVLNLKYGKFSMLFTGDLEEKGEQYLLKQSEEWLSEVTILKVAHHGSKNSTIPSFLDKVNPRFAVISCGRGNRYGHPHRELLERLVQNNTLPMTTMDYGAIEIITNGKQVKINPFKKKKLDWP